ncbi:MAG: DPP IV N-terminal domain-containing protein [Bryobacteraceae bacterium]
MARAFAGLRQHAFRLRLHLPGYKRSEIREADAAMGRVRTLVEEKSYTFVDPDSSYQRWLQNDTDLIFFVRDGWNHLYLYNARTASLENRTTHGDWVVRSIEHVDDKNRQVYFLAGGHESGENPYPTHLYRVRLDGTSLELPTP